MYNGLWCFGYMDNFQELIQYNYKRCDTNNDRINVEFNVKKSMVIGDWCPKQNGQTYASAYSALRIHDTKYPKSEQLLYSNE